MEGVECWVGGGKRRDANGEDSALGKSSRASEGSDDRKQGSNAKLGMACKTKQNTVLICTKQ